MQGLNQLKDHLVIVKSTVPSYKIEAIQEQCINLKIVYIFLKESLYTYSLKNIHMANPYIGESLYRGILI